MQVPRKRREDRLHAGAPELVGELPECSCPGIGGSRLQAAFPEPAECGARGGSFPGCHLPAPGYQRNTTIPAMAIAAPISFFHSNGDLSTPNNPNSSIP